jgi:phosphoglycerate kinase
LKELSDAGARVGILSHFGRPNGEKNPAMSLKPIAQALSSILNKDVSFCADCIGHPAMTGMDNLPAGGLTVLENTRFHPGEEANDEAFIKSLSAPADAFVNDAFSAAHRAHASTEGMARILPSYAGRSLQKELEALETVLGNPTRPVMAVVGGAKISTKLDLLFNLISKVDTLVIGGGMANTFMAAQGIAIGRSLCEESMFDKVRDILRVAQDSKCEILLPDDVVLAENFAATDSPVSCQATQVPDDMMILDAGPLAVSKIKAAIEKSKTLVWNGPLGAFELSPFDEGTKIATQFAAQQTVSGKLVSVAGGGDTVAALNHSDAADGFTYISTAGGAFLEWLEGKTLPAIDTLQHNTLVKRLG